MGDSEADDDDDDDGDCELEMGAVAPASHRAHSPEHDAVSRPGVSPKVPAGQRTGAAVPASQKDPGGQITAVAFVEPDGQNQPAVHGPEHVAVICPVVSPNEPASHGVLAAGVVQKNPTGLQHGRKKLD